MIVLLDLDGTVWDSEPGIVACLRHAFAELGLAVPDHEVLSGGVGPPLQTMLAELGVPGDRLDEGVAHYRERYLRAGVFEASLYEGVVEMLDGLAGSGHRLATATSKGEVPTRIMLDHFGLMGRFDVVGAATMDTTAVTKAQVLSRTLAALDDPPPDQCVLVGDRSYDVEGAAAHGLHCIGATWGYGGADELRMAGAELLAARPPDVCALVDGGSFRT